MDRTEALGAVEAIANDIRSLVGPLKSWVFSPDAVDRLAIEGLRHQVRSLALAMVDAPADDVETVAIALDAVCAHDEYARDELAGRFRSGVRRFAMLAKVRRHPRADRFYTLIQAVARGRATSKQMELATKLAAEVA